MLQHKMAAAATAAAVHGYSRKPSFHQEHSWLCNMTVHFYFAKKKKKIKNLSAFFPVGLFFWGWGFLIYHLQYIFLPFI